MDRHSATSAIRVGKLTAWRLALPTVLVLIGFQAAMAQSTLRIATGPVSGSSSQSNSAEAANASNYNNPYAPSTGTTTEIRIVEPSNLPPATRLPVAKSHDLWSPLSGSEGAGANRTPSSARSTFAPQSQVAKSSRRQAAPAAAQPVVPTTPAMKPIAQLPVPTSTRMQPLAPRQDAPVAFRPAAPAQPSTIAIVEVQPTQTPVAPPAVAKPAAVRTEGSAKFVATVESPQPAPEQVKIVEPAAPKVVAQPVAKLAEVVRPAAPVKTELPQTAAPAVRIAMAPPAAKAPVAIAKAPVVVAQAPAPVKPRQATAADSVPRSQRTMAFRLFASGLKDKPAAAPQVAQPPVAKLAPAAVASVKPSEPRVAIQPEIKPVPASPIAVKEPTIAIPTEAPKVAQQPKPERSVLAARPTPAPAAPQPAVAAAAPTARNEIFSPPATLARQAQPAQMPGANTQYATPGRVASTTTSPAPAADAMAGMPLQQPRIYRPLQHPPQADGTLRQPQDDRPLEKMTDYPPAELAKTRVATLEPVPARKVPLAAAVRPQPTPTESFTFADRKQPMPTMVAQQPTMDHKEMKLPESAMVAPEASLKQSPMEESEVLVDPMAPTEYATRPSAAAPFGCPYLPGQSGAPYVCGVDCGRYGAPCNSSWQDSQCIPWSLFGPGEYVGPARTEHVSTYFLRVNDLITLTYINSRKKEAEKYRIGCGDRLSIEWLRGPNNEDIGFNRESVVQPDGTIVMPLVGEVNAVGKTVPELNEDLNKLYSKFQRDPQITVTPVETNMGIRDVIHAVTSVSGSNGQTQALKVTPEGTIQASGLGSVFVQGLTLDELRSELEARYASTFGPGLLVSPALTEKATSYVFVGGEVKVPARYTLEGPTTVMQAITLAGGWNIGGNLHQVVVFRRDENWCLKAIKIDIRAPLYGHDPCPANDVWLRDNDLVIVPKSCILCATDVINLYFTRGIYAVFPISYVYDFSQGSAIVPVP